MIRPQGFTVVELMVVMVVMAILLTLGVASFSSSQTNARDAERSADMATVAKGLEARYLKGNTIISASYISQGAYPSVNEILQAENQTVSGLPAPSGVYIDQLLPGTKLANFYPPTASSSADISTTFKVICTNNTTSPCASSVTAEDSTKINAAINGSSSVYVYEPIDASNNICFSSLCVRYNLYYLTEAGTLQTVASKHQ